MSKYQLPYEKFMEDWLQNYERIEYLKLDEIKANVLPTLKNWRAYTNKIILVTMRHNKQNLMYQLDSLNLLSNLDEVIMCDSLTGSKKYDLIKHLSSTRPYLLATLKIFKQQKIWVYLCRSFKWFKKEKIYRCRFLCE